MRKYESLFPRYKNQPASEVFAHFPFDHATGENWETPFEKLANLAKKEEWNFHRPEFRKPHVRFPILENYLNYTFLRLVEQGKIMIANGGASACFNTGLLTADEKEIFALFQRDARSKTDESLSDWRLDGFFDTYSNRLRDYRAALPEIATYVEDASDLVLDINYDIDINVGHILDDPDNQDRLPVEVRNNRTLAMAAIEGAGKFMKKKVIRNYKTAIPQWYMPAKKLQLLLPLCLVQPDRADLALVAEKDQEARVYRVRTALSVDMAYSNARLLTRPDREWLDP